MRGPGTGLEPLAQAARPASGDSLHQVTRGMLSCSALSRQRPLDAKRPAHGRPNSPTSRSRRGLLCQADPPISYLADGWIAGSCASPLLGKLASRCRNQASPRRPTHGQPCGPGDESWPSLTLASAVGKSSGSRPLSWLKGARAALNATTHNFVTRHEAAPARRPTITIRWPAPAHITVSLIPHVAGRWACSFTARLPRSRRTAAATSRCARPPAGPAAAARGAARPCAAAWRARSDTPRLRACAPGDVRRQRRRTASDRRSPDSSPVTTMAKMHTAVTSPSTDCR